MGLDIIELFMDIEKEFELDIPDEDAVTLETVGLLYDYLCRRSPRLTGTPAGVYTGWAWDRLAQLIREAAPPFGGEVRPQAHLVRDLGLG